MSWLPSAHSFDLESPARVILIFANHLPSEPKFSHSPFSGEAAEGQALLPEKFSSASFGALAIVLCQ